MKPTEILMRKVASVINNSIIKELHDQGHLLLAELEVSLRKGVTITDNTSLNLEGRAVDYILKMENGVSPSELGDKRTHLQKLYYFYLRIGFDSKTATRKAKALLPHHYKEGTPTKYSKRFSKTGERKHFIASAWRSNEQKVDNLMNQGMDSIFNEEFSKQKNETI